MRFLYSHDGSRVLRIMLTGIVIVTGTLFSGCSPAGFAASALIIQCYLNEQAKTNRPTVYPSRQQPILISRQPETVHTPVPQFEDRKTVEKANQAYRNLEWNESVRLLKGAINRGELSRSDQSEAYILLGAMAYQQGQVNEAKNYFKKTSEIDSSVTPSAELYPPPLIEFYKSVAKRK